MEKDKGSLSFVDKSSFEVNLASMPSEIHGCKLNVSKDDDGRWVVVYETDYGYLKSKSDRHNECVHSNISLEVAINETVSWINENV